MEFQAIHDRLKSIDAPGLLGFDLPRSPDKETKDKGRSGNPYVEVDPQQLVHFLGACKSDPELHFEMLVDITASDPSADGEDLWVLTEIISVKHKHRLSIKSILPKAAATMPSTVPAHRASQWHERECSEMYGITFEGHPDPRHILLPDDWEGFPMRKDYVFPTEYHGISCE